MVPRANPGSSALTQWPLLLACAAAVVMTLDITIVNVALPAIADSLRASLTGLQWVINAYTLSFAALLLTGGSLVDRFGTKSTFTAGTAVFAVASAVCGIAPNLLTLEIFRALQGAGAALVFPAALAMIAKHYTGTKRKSAISIFSAAGAAAGGLGPLVGGVVVEGVDWRWIFYINVPIAALMATGTLLKIPGSAAASEAGRGSDLTGAVLAIAALFSLNYALLVGPSAGWRSGEVLGTGAAGLVLLAAFVWTEVRHPRPMLNIGLFKIPAFSSTMFLIVVIRTASFGVWPFLVLWLQGVLHYSAVGTGLRFLAMTLLIMVVAPFNPRLQARFGTLAVTTVGFVVAVAALLSMVRVGADSSWPTVLPGFIGIGIGVGLAFPPLMGVAIDAVPPDRAGMASGAVNTFFPLGTAIGVAVLGALFASRIGAGLSAAKLSAAGLPTAGAGQVRANVAAGRLDRLVFPAEHRAAGIALVREVFTSALGAVFLLAALVSLLGAVSCLLLVRLRAQQTAPKAGETPSSVAEQT